MLIHHLKPSIHPVGNRGNCAEYPLFGQCPRTPLYPAFGERPNPVAGEGLSVTDIIAERVASMILRGETPRAVARHFPTHFMIHHEGITKLWETVHKKKWRGNR